MSKSRHAIVAGLMVLMASILVTACGGGGGGGTANISANTAASDALFTDPTNAVNITVQSDASRAASQVVDATGGTLTATDANGSTFTLDIPASAVQQATTITMTPLASASGVPLANGMVAGVQLAPEGQFFYKEATLTIVPGTSVPIGNQTFLGYSASGADLHLVSPASPTATIQIPIGHFSGYMLGNGTSTDRAALLLKRAADHEARLNQEVARVLGEERQLQLLGVSDGTADMSVLNNYLESYYGLVLYPRILAASASCANAELALKTLLGYERQRQLLGIGSRSSFQSDMAAVTQALSTTCAFMTSTVSSGDLTVGSQTICRLDQPFTLAMGGLYSGNFNYVPVNITTGSVSYSAQANGIPAYGAGTYSVTGEDILGTLALTNTTNDCISVPGVGNICNTNTLSIPLKRLDHGC